MVNLSPWSLVPSTVQLWPALLGGLLSRGPGGKQWVHRVQVAPAPTLRAAALLCSARSTLTSSLARATSCGSVDSPSSASASASPSSLSAALALCVRCWLFSRSQLQPQQRGQGSGCWPPPRPVCPQAQGLTVGHRWVCCPTSSVCTNRGADFRPPAGCPSLLSPSPSALELGWQQHTEVLRLSCDGSHTEEARKGARQGSRLGLSCHGHRGGTAGREEQVWELQREGERFLFPESLPCGHHAICITQKTDREEGAGGGGEEGEEEEKCREEVTQIGWGPQS